MATRIPLVLVDGEIENFTTGDTVDPSYLPVSSGASGVKSSVTLDFGLDILKARKFTFAAPGVLTSSLVTMSPSPSAVNGARGGDELEMDGFQCAAYCLLNGTITSYITSSSFVRGKRNFIYNF